LSEKRYSFSDSKQDVFQSRERHDRQETDYLGAAKTKQQLPNLELASYDHTRREFW